MLLLGLMGVSTSAMSSSSVTSASCVRARLLELGTLVLLGVGVEVVELRGFLGVAGTLLIARSPAFPEEARAVWRMRTRRSVMARGVGLSFVSVAAVSLSK